MSETPEISGKLRAIVKWAMDAGPRGKNLEYAGCQGSVHFSAEDNVFYGKILSIPALVSYEGHDAQSLESNFKAAVDEYVELRKTMDTERLTLDIIADDKPAPFIARANKAFERLETGACAGRAISEAITKTHGILLKRLTR